MVRGKTIGEGKDNKKRDGDGVGAELRKVRDMKCKESGVLRTSGGCAARTFEGESGKEVRRISGGCAADILEENSMTGEMGGKEETRSGVRMSGGCAVGRSGGWGLD